MNTAIMITGTVCSGKSTISKKIQKELNIKLIDELNVSPNGLFGIKSEIKNSENNDIVLIEHAEMLSIIDEVKGYIKKIIIILLNVSDDILIKNKNERISQNIGGDYLKANILDMKKELVEKFNNIKYDCIKYIANINVYEDYETEYDNIINNYLYIYRKE